MGIEQTNNGLEKGDLSIVVVKLNQSVFKHVASLDEEDYDLLHDIIDDLFSVSCSKEQILKLLQVCPNFDGCLKSEIVNIVQNDLCQHFVGQPMVKNDISREKREIFWLKIENCNQNFLNYIIISQMKFNIPKNETVKLDDILKLLTNYEDALTKESEYKLRAETTTSIDNNKISIDFTVRVFGRKEYYVKLFNILLIDMDKYHLIFTTYTNGKTNSETTTFENLEREIDQFIQTEEVGSVLSNLLKLANFYK